ncbi:MAG: CoA transferase [Dehalococcoidia bacterium]|nr:CoA transferase [Dehalococcoidia bacterium]
MPAVDTVPSGALRNLRVIDLTRVWAGPLGTRTLGDFGAEVIKVSDPRIPLSRVGKVNDKLNRNKLNIAIRLDKREGRNILLDLVSIGDVVIENFRPRVVRNLDITYEKLIEANPNLLMCSMPGFGLDGPYSEYPAFGSTAEAMAGINSMIGYVPDRPLQTGLSYADPISGLNLVNVILAFARRRSVTGKGSFIDLALADSPLGTLGEFFVANSATGYMQHPNGNLHSQYSPHGVFKCFGEDKWIAISITSHFQWERLKDEINDIRLDNADYSNISGRKTHEQAIIRIIEEWTSGKDAAELMGRLQAQGIPAAKVSNNLDVLEDSHLNEREYFAYFKTPEEKVEKYDGQAIPGNQKERSEWFSMRNLGEDSSSIVMGYLGYSKDKYVSLLEQEVIS